MYSGLKVTSRLQYRISRLILGLRALFLESQADLPPFSFFPPYMVAWPVLCYPVRACWHNHRLSSLALGCSRDFLPILACFLAFNGLRERCPAERERFSH